MRKHTHIYVLVVFNMRKMDPAESIFVEYPEYK